MDARNYLINNVLIPLHPSIEPLPTLIGVCTQVDNAASEILRLRAQIAAKDAQIAALLKVKEAAQRVIDENYGPRIKRPGKCQHQVWYYDICGVCLDAELGTPLDAYAAWETANAKL